MCVNMSHLFLESILLVKEYREMCPDHVWWKEGETAYIRLGGGVVGHQLYQALHTIGVLAF